MSAATGKTRNTREKGSGRASERADEDSGFSDDKPTVVARKPEPSPGDARSDLPAVDLASPPDGAIGRLRSYLGERGVRRSGTPATIPGPASFARALGSVLVFLFAVEAVTGGALAAFYAPSSTDAWASVAYVQDQATLGWLIRGLHFHAGSAIVIISGLHLVHTALIGAYKQPRELVWWLGVVLLIATLGWAVTGYVLRWDQAGFWANQVEVGIAAATPIAGGWIRQLVLGGNDYGNLTLTRFYALHVLAFPLLVGALVWAHVALSRRLGATPVGRVQEARPRWPEQGVRDAIAIAAVFAALLAYVIAIGGVELAAPADPSAAYDARPLWYFRWLFELRELAGSAEKLVALAAPAIVAGVLIGLPLVDRAPSRTVRERRPYLGALVGMCALIAGLTVASLVGDAGDDQLAKRELAEAQRAQLARKLAREYGVPSTGAADVFFAAPMARARALFATRCKGCHDANSKDRKGPVIAAGHGNRAWIRSMVVDPNGDALWGRTKLSKQDTAMKSFAQMPPGEIDEVVELLYADTGATDVDPAKRDHGKEVFEKACSDCHARDEGMPGASGPGLGGLGSRAFYLSFISNPKSALHMGRDNSQMPRFDHELTLADRDALAEYLVWLRTATPADLAAMDE